jgi:hypothetical protein
MLASGEPRPREGQTMEYEIERNRTWQLASLLLTAVLVGGALAFALAS